VSGGAEHWFVPSSFVSVEKLELPRATALLSRFTLTDKQLSQLLVWVDTEHMTDAQAVERFIKENQDLVWYMIGGLAPNLNKPASLN